MFLFYVHIILSHHNIGVKIPSESFKMFSQFFLYNIPLPCKLSFKKGPSGCELVIFIREQVHVCTLCHFLCSCQLTVRNFLAIIQHLPNFVALSQLFNLGCQFNVSRPEIPCYEYLSVILYYFLTAFLDYLPFLDYMYIIIHVLISDVRFILLKEGGHDNRVNDLCWSEDDSTLYSCSNDKHITEWNTEKGERKW